MSGRIYKQGSGGMWQDVDCVHSRSSCCCCCARCCRDCCCCCCCCCSCRLNCDGRWGVVSIIYGLMRDLFAFVNDEVKVKGTKCQQLATAAENCSSSRGGGRKRQLGGNCSCSGCNRFAKKLIKSAIKQQQQQQHNETQTRPRPRAGARPSPRP